MKNSIKTFIALYLLFFFSFVCKSFSFTLNTNTSASFSSKEVKFYLTSNSDCTNTGISNDELLHIAKEAVNHFWNTVATSSIRIKNGGLLNTNDPLYLTGKLCANDTNGSCDKTTTVPIDNDIIIACNNNIENFPTSNILALTGPTNTSGSTISGSVILINNSVSSGFSTLSFHEKRAVLAHEFGHALGLGHSKKDEALMYYHNADKIHRLAQDDRDGISYLYPNKLDGCGGFFGGINIDKSKGFLISTIYGLIFYILLIHIPKFFIYFLRRIRLYSIN